MALAPAATARAEVGALARLAGPLMVAQLAQMAMGVVGTVAAGRLGVDALAAQALGSTTLVLVIVTGYGLMAGLDPHVARAVGEDDPKKAGALYRQAIWIAVLGGALLTGALLTAPALLRAMGQEPRLVTDTAEYLDIAALGLVPAITYITSRSFCSAVGKARPVMVVAILGNIVNAWLAFAAVDRGYGLAGIAWASVVCRVAMGAALVVWVDVAPGLQRYRTAWVRPGALSLPILRSGTPLALQYLMEVTGFVVTTLWMGLLGASTLAAHEVALSIAAIAFQVPFAIGTAASMRVGHAIGRRDPAAVQRSGWTAFGLGLLYALGSGAVMVALREWMALQYLPSATAEVIALTCHFLTIAAGFQIADGIQAIGFGVLRGMDDTRVPVLFNILGFWLLGMPLGYIAVFRLHQHADRLWWGLFLSLAVVATSLILRFRHKSRTLQIV
ncbi:MAG: MATE family efflux transporter [Deltaproteobacteria bacterium]|nr:MATE family efflux transporter [Deltaproteobacteria bacterium]